jgi:hypothetical protein
MSSETDNRSGEKNEERCGKKFKAMLGLRAQRLDSMAGKAEGVVSVL